MRAKALCIPAVFLSISGILKFSMAQSSSPSQQPPNQASSVLRAETRLVTVDVVATDSHGNVVRDLKAEDFDLSDGGRQKIQKFAFIDKSASSATAAQPQPPGVYSNQAEISSLPMPPTVVLLDSLNTNTADLLTTRQHMLDLLKSLPSGAPVAVFLLGESLSVVQDFTSDPAVLRAAIDKAMRPTVQQGPLPEDDPLSVSLAMFENGGEQESDTIQQIEDWEMEVYANTMDVRLTTTLDALTGIAHYLSAYQGRKNLVWVSESFPVALIPDPNFGTGRVELSASRDYGEMSQEAANALSDAHVAVYPVDARGLDTIQFYGASGRPVITQTPRGRGAGVNSASADIMRETQSRQLSQDAMDEIAGATGGRTCKTTNDLSGCVESALKDSSSYYELGYLPDNIKWDGNFRKITVKTGRSGVRLAYRGGYYAIDPQLAASSQTPEQLLQEACRDFLPSTTIPITAQDVPADQPNNARYIMSIAPGALTVETDGQDHKVNAMMATCIFAPDGHQSEFLLSDLSQTLSDPEYQASLTTGFRGYIEAPRAGTARVRIAVLDGPTSSIGALDVLPPRTATTETATSNTPAASSAAASVPPSAGSSQPNDSATSIAFSDPSGQSGLLDWGGGKVVYQGTLSPSATAPVFFAQYFAKDFHCDSGQLVPNSPNGHPPSLTMTFTDLQGRAIKISLKGDQPEYSGTLPIDDSAKSFFGKLWTLTHCQGE